MSTLAKDTVSNTPALTLNNWETWYARVVSALKGYQIHYLIQTLRTEPLEPESSTPSTEMIDDEQLPSGTTRRVLVNFGDSERERKEKEKYEQDCNIFHSIMELVLDEAAKANISHLSDPYQVIEKLRSLYSSNKIGRVIKLTDELWVKMEKGGDVVKYINNKVVAAKRLKTLLGSQNFNLPEPLLVSAIVGGLPETEFGIIQGRFKSMDLNKASVDDLITEIVNEVRTYEEDKNLSASKTVAPEARVLTAELRPAKNRYTKQRYNGPDCTFCGSKHPEERCWWKNPEKAPEGWRKGKKRAAEEEIQASLEKQITFVARNNNASHYSTKSGSPKCDNTPH